MRKKRVSSKKLKNEMKALTMGITSCIIDMWKHKDSDCLSTS